MELTPFTISDKRFQSLIHVVQCLKKVYINMSQGIVG